MSRSVLPLLAIAGTLVACSPTSPMGFDVGSTEAGGDEADAMDGPEPDGGGRDDPDDPSEDAGVSDADDSDDSGSNDSGGDDSGQQRGIPDRITTDGGASFRAKIDAGEAETVEVVANEGDVVIIRLKRAEQTDWSPGLFLYEPGQGTSGEAIVYSVPDSGDAHIPYEDSAVEDGWEFYNSGAYPMKIENQADSPGKLAFELTCLSGPCTDGSGGGDDYLAADEDNCPNTSNPSQANRDGDIWGDACDPKPSSFECPQSLSGSQLEKRLRGAYRKHQVLSYEEAREAMFSNIENTNDKVTTVYLGETFETTTIPNPNYYNTEHTWPQSKMQDDNGARRSDLHHLFPADSMANSKRSNLPLDDVTGRLDWSSNGSRRGENDRGWKSFEPRDAHKGDAARALFYYAVMYERDITIDVEPDGWGIGTGDEQALRNWHNNVDPVSQEERARNDLVQHVQGNRNPFVDCPGLVGKISDF